MQSNWVRLCSNPLNNNMGRQIRALVLFAAILWNSLSFATITLKATSGGSLGSFTPLLNQLVTNPTFYYFVNYGGAPNSVPVSPAFLLGVAPLNLDATALSDAPSFLNRFEVSFYSQSAGTTANPQSGVVVIQVVGASSTTTPIFAPIATYNGTPCNDGICQARSLRPPPDGTIRYFAAKYIQGQTINIGFYLNDICSYYQALGGTPPPSGCLATNTVAKPTPGVPTTIQLRFAFYPVASTDPTAQASGNAIDSLQYPVTFSLQQDTPTLSCPSQDVLNTLYFPGDSQITLDASVFSLNLPVSNNAPANSFTVVAKNEAVRGVVPTPVPNPLPASMIPIVDSTFQSANDFVSSVDANNNPLALASGQVITGILNRTSTVKNSYAMSFIVQDQAGIYVPPSKVSSCIIYPVQAVDVQGFLKSSKCFIATAAFRSVESAPVEILRNFRDQVLVRYAWGQAFVQWYYEWSPEVAEWLMSHTYIRLPVLFWLAPIELLAWLSISPNGILFFIGTIFFLAGLITISVRSKKQRGEKLR